MTRILVVGDGDLAYSAGLAQKRTDAVVWGSVLPSRPEQVRLYGEKVVQKREAAIQRVFYSVDCTKCEDHFTREDAIDEVHFNFPHLGYDQQAERGGSWSRAGKHVELFRNMFASLKKIQSSKSTMKLTLTKTPPYKVSDVKKCAVESGYFFTEELPFDSSQYPDYHPAWGDDRDLIKHGTSNYGVGGRQFIFTNLNCYVCSLSCTSMELFNQHLGSPKHAFGLRSQLRAEKASKTKRANTVTIHIPKKGKVAFKKAKMKLKKKRGVR
eukprot:TRINITY_DN18135_c0_g1_i1.p1 TRINITY_DN18135_c0_g1~~TRINITY_DN18135_c0_g1_i1.p1  ORF type:complete len:268 (+),score=43.06 TRINITY_DN18135_c0_g1_i1:113-916(+)